MVCLWLAVAAVLLLLLILINKDTYFGCVYVCVKENIVHESLSDVYGPLYMDFVIFRYSVPYKISGSRMSVYH